MGIAKSLPRKKGKAGDTGEHSECAVTAAEDLLYVNVKEAYRAAVLPPLGT